MKKISLHLFVILILVISFLSCKKETDLPFELPPIGSMDFKADEFPEGKTGEVQGGPNFNFAALNVAFWNLAITTNLIVPAVAFRESFNHSPTLANGIWAWTYAFYADSAWHTARLTAEENNNEISWTMYISRAGAFQDLLWFSGVSATDNSTGQWILNADPTNPHPALQLDWQKNGANGNEVNYIIFLNIIPGDENNGGYIEAARNVAEDLDSHYNIWIPAQNNEVNIEWSKEALNGRVKCANHFQDQNWHCWDSALQDISC